MKTKFVVSLAGLMLCLSALIAGCSTPTEIATATPSRTLRPTSTQTETPYPTRTLTPTPKPTVDPCEDDNPYNGYLYHDTCIPGVVTDEFWLSPNPKHFVGVSSYYAKGIMEQVVENRGLSMNGYHGAVALMMCGDIGKSVWIKRSTAATFQGPYLVADCSGKNHLYFNVMTGIVVEVDYHTAVRWGIPGNNLPTVHVCKGRSGCGTATTLITWFQQNVTWESDPDE